MLARSKQIVEKLENMLYISEKHLKQHPLIFSEGDSKWYVWDSFEGLVIVGMAYV